MILTTALQTMATTMMIARNNQKELKYIHHSLLILILLPSDKSAGPRDMPYRSTKPDPIDWANHTALNRHQGVPSSEILLNARCNSKRDDVTWVSIFLIRSSRSENLSFKFRMNRTLLNLSRSCLLTSLFIEDISLSSCSCHWDFTPGDDS